MLSRLVRQTGARQLSVTERTEFNTSFNFEDDDEEDFGDDGQPTPLNATSKKRPMLREFIRTVSTMQFFVYSPPRRAESLPETAMDLSRHQEEIMPDPPTERTSSRRSSDGLVANRLNSHCQQG